MSPSPADHQPLDELRFALAQGNAQEPPVALRQRVLQAATSARPPGVAAGTAKPITAAEAYRRTMVSFDQVLSGLRDDQWHAPALRGLDVQGLVGHLIGVERMLHEAVGIGPALGRSGDHVTSTQPDALAQAGRAPAETRADWRQLTDRTVAYASGLDPADRNRLVTLHSITIPFDRLLVVRLFETWTHEEDIRRAVGLGLLAPDSARLRLMTDLAVSALPTGLSRIGRRQPGCTARMVLTGPGGGTWQASLDRGTPGPTDVRIVADAAMFCRLAANRAAEGQLGAFITGDDQLAAAVLAGARALAFD